MTLDQYIAYKQDSELDKDMAADFGTDTVVINFLEQQRKLLQGFQKTEPSVERALLHGEIALLVLKETEPEIYDAVTSEANRRLQQVTAREPQG